MAKIKKVIENGGIQYPATITDAVKNPNNGKTVTQELTELGSEVKATVNTNDTNYFANSGINENGNGFVSENYISMKKAVPVNDNVDTECVVNGGTASGVMVFYNDSNEIIYTSGTWNKTIQSSDFKGATKVIASFGFDVENAEIKQNGDILWRKETTGTVSGKVSELENYINGDVISVTENYVVQRIPNTSQIVYIHRFGYLTLDQLIEVEEGTVNWVHKDDVPRSCIVYLLDENLEYVDIYYSDRNVITIPSNVRYIKASFKDADGIMLSQNGVVLFDKSMIGSKMSGAKNMVLQNKLNSKAIRKDLELIKSLIGVEPIVVPSEKEESVTTIDVEVGKNYTFFFLETNWSRSWVKGNIDYVYAFYGDVEYFARSPLYYPDGVEPYIDIVAKTENVSIRFRKDKGEELHWYVVEMKESSELTTVIGNARKDVDGVNGNLLSSTIDNNGGFLQLKRVFENLKITMKDKNTPCVLAWTSDAHNSLDNLERMLNFCSTFEDYIDDIIHTGDGVADKITDSNPFENIDGGSKVLNVVGNHDCNDINHAVGNTDIASGLHTYEKLFANNIQYWNVVQPTDASSLGKCYYYKDYQDSKLRVVVLDCMHWDSSQKSWFEEVLNSAISIDYHVIAVSHYIFSGFVSGIRKCTFHSIFGEKYVPLNAQRLNEEASDCVASAINNGLKFVCWMFGHLHYDVFVQSTKHEEQFGIGITRTSNVSSYSSDSIRSKYKDRDAFNIISVDTTLGIITVKRIGDTYDKLLRSRNNLVFDYINREILFND